MMVTPADAIGALVLASVTRPVMAPWACAPRDPTKLIAVTATSSNARRVLRAFIALLWWDFYGDNPTPWSTTTVLLAAGVEWQSGSRLECHLRHTTERHPEARGAEGSLSRRI